MATKTTADPRTSKLGALTTQWTAPASCQAEWLESVVVGSGTTADAWFRPSMRCGASEAELDTACFPSPYGAAVTSMLSRFMTPFFSPGISCPSGWKSDGLTFGTGIPTSMAYSLNLAADETAAMCCPTGWQFGGNLVGCTSKTLTGEQTANACINGKPSIVTVSYTDPKGYSSGVFSASGTTYSVWTWKHLDAVQLVWKSDDLSGHSIATTGDATSATSPAQNSAATTAQSSVTTTAASEPTQSSSGDSGLSTNSKIAIGVAVPLGWIAICLIILTLIIRYRAMKQKIEHLSHTVPTQPPQPEARAEFGQKAELETPVVTQGAAYMHPFTPGGQWPVHEMPQPVPELEAHIQPFVVPSPSDKHPYKGT